LKFDESVINEHSVTNCSLNQHCMSLFPGCRL